MKKVTAKDLQEKLSQAKMDELFKWINELSKSKVSNIKKILKWTSPKEFEKIEKAIIVHFEKGKIKSAEDVEAFVDQNYNAEDFK